MGVIAIGRVDALSGIFVAVTTIASCPQATVPVKAVTDSSAAQANFVMTLLSLAGTIVKGAVFIHPPRQQCMNVEGRLPG